MPSASHPHDTASDTRNGVDLRLSAAPDGEHDIGLPILPRLGAYAEAKMAIEHAITSRRGALLCGPKGTGKTVGVLLALAWLADRERDREEADPTYRRPHVLELTSLRNADYRTTALAVATALDEDYEPKVGHAKKGGNEIRDDVAHMCLAKRFGLIVCDEAEVLSVESLNFFRDVMSVAEKASTDRIKDGEIKAAGVGVLLVGDLTTESRVAATSEAEQRWARSTRVSPLTPEQVVEVYAAWFPGFASQIATMGDTMWVNFLETLVCRDESVPLRLLENHARSYVMTYRRVHGAHIPLQDVQLDAELFRRAFMANKWADEARPEQKGRAFSARTSWGGRRDA